MKLRPLYDRIMVERMEDEEKTKSGIIIPEAAREKQQKGKVVAVGKGRINDDGKITPLDVKVGDVILFEKYGGEDLKVDGKEYVILKEEGVVGVVEG